MDNQVKMNKDIKIMKYRQVFSFIFQFMTVVLLIVILSLLVSCSANTTGNEPRPEFLITEFNQGDICSSNFMLLNNGSFLK